MVYRRKYGFSYTTTSNSSFSSIIQAGDFIAADFDSDGDWNHMGFVTDRKTTQSNGYYDYRVAQHTSNYHEWTSSSKNGWENVGKDGGTYGRVKR